METRVIAAARWKSLLLVLGSAAFVAVPVAEAILGKPVGLDIALGGVFFGLCLLVGLVLLIRPQRLTLDGQGYTLDGGLRRGAQRIEWAAIDHFFVYRLPRGGTMIGFRWREGHERTGLIAAASRAMGVDAALPRGWAMPQDRLVELLNDYVEASRRRAVNPVPGVAGGFGRARRG